MTWNSVAPSYIEVMSHLRLWIETARVAGYVSSDWLPTNADVSKSALLERIRSGKEPLKYPPPRGMSCPWYALVEDPMPQCVGWGNHAVILGPDGFILQENQVSVMQNTYEIVERKSEFDFIIRDLGHNDTPYRFRLWYDYEWVRPKSIRLPDAGTGSWFLQNTEHIK